MAETLTRMLIDVGLLNPDGSPAIGPESQEEPAMAAEMVRARRPLDARQRAGGRRRRKTLDAGVAALPVPSPFGRGLG